ncbi:MAG: alpha/beta fold hydrolase, partial [Cyanobacteria bacterium P01_H01_bin.35]
LDINQTSSSEEKILSQLQSGEISLENAESLLLDINQTSSEEKLLAQLQSGEISLENAESLLLDINQTSSEEKLLAQLQAGEISLENAESLLLETEAKTPQQKAKAKQSTSVENTDIAIIGISCKYPGSNNWQEFWKNLKNGVDSVTEISPEKWQQKNWFNPDPENSDTSYSKWSGFLDDVDKFDPFFFKISPGEAKYIEPQQRIFLEEAYHAIEDAGYSPESFKGKQCGVFVGAANGDYVELLLRSGLHTNRQVLTGNSVSVLPARIAYFLDLRGPVMAIETACSSSLVAIHQACESIQKGESELALAGGITLMLTPTQNIVTSQFRMLSPEGRCKTFDASASGIVWSEGCGIILLKPYDKAIQDKDNIYGVIKASGINYDGKTNGITAPSGQSQIALEKRVYEKFQINPESISFVEAHGTGTPLGDPIEVDSLTQVYSEYTNSKQYCAISSVKTNIGHTAWAAGVASVIKAVLCLKYQKLVPSLHFNEANPYLDLENSPFYVNTEYKDWEIAEGKPRRVAVSSLGFSGTNAHAILEEAPFEVRSRRGEWPFARTVGGEDNGKNEEDKDERPFHILTLSAKSEKALTDLVSRYQSYLENNPEIRLADLCYTTNTGRTHFEHRLAIVTSDKQKLAEKLLLCQAGETEAGIFSGQLLNNQAPKVAFLFTGQGSQYINMGRQLYQQAPVFRRAIDECDQILRQFHQISLLEIIYPDNQDESSSSLIDQTAYTQPSLFAVEYALFKLWQSWGIQPNVVMGHSVGEYVAATVAGVFSLEDGLKLIAARGRLMQELPAGGEMVAVLASESKVSKLLAPYAEKVAFAAINGPESVVISGAAEAIQVIINDLKSEKIKTKQLQVSHAFHSPLMEPMLAEFAAVAEGVSYYLPQLPIISNITGSLADNSIATTKYWVDHVQQPVRFAQGMEALHQQNLNIFLEVGPKPILLGMGRKCLPENLGMWLPSLRPGVEEWQQILSSLGELYTQGAKVDWFEFNREYSCQKVVLPTYPFERQRYWIETSENNFLPLENGNTQILQLINQGKIETLAEELQQTGDFSQAEAELLPKVLEMLVKQHQQEIETNSKQEKAPEQKQKSQKQSELIEKLQKSSPKECKQLLIDYLKQKVCHILQINTSHSLNLQKSILELGFDSLSAVELRSKIETQLEVTIPADRVLSGPSIIALADILAQQLTENNYSSEDRQELAEQTNNWIAYHKPKPNASIRLICFHPWGASASMFQQWSYRLSSNIEVLPVQLPGRQRRINEEPFTDFVALIQTLADALHPYLDKPCAFFGHSMGALIAFELAHILEAEYDVKLQHLFLGATMPPSDFSFLQKISSLSEEEKLNYLLELAEIPENILGDRSLWQELIKVFNADLRLLESYNYSERKQLNCPIYGLGGIDDPAVQEKNILDWSQYTKSTFKIKMIPGKHMFLQDSQKLILDIIDREIKT